MRGEKRSVDSERDSVVSTPEGQEKPWKLGVSRLWCKFQLVNVSVFEAVSGAGLRAG